MTDGGKSPTAGATPKPAPSRKTQSRLHLSIDRMLIGGGLATAFCSLAFAGYMIGDRDRRPYFPGGEYLAIFARPNHGIQVAAHPSPAIARLDAPGDPHGVDPTPTGSIQSPSRADPPDGAALPSLRYRLVAASRDAAWVESELGFRQIKPGEVLPGLGRIAAIEQRNGRWTVTTDNALTLELNDGASVSSEATGGGRFARPMIFGREAR
jgi:hypothetical protein